MNLCLRGMTKNLISDLKSLKSNIERLKSDALENPYGSIKELDIDEIFENENLDSNIIYVEAYFDIITAILQGKTTIEEAKAFLYSSGKLEETKLYNNLIIFD